MTDTIFGIRHNFADSDIGISHITVETGVGIRQFAPSSNKTVTGYDDYASKHYRCIR